MKKLLLTIALICFCYTSNSYAGVYLENMYKGCAKWNDFQKNENISFADGEFTNMMRCKSFTIGWMRAGNAANITNENLSLLASVIGCRTKGEYSNGPIKPEIVSRLFVKYLDDNPKEFSEPIDVVMYRVLNDAYPCD
tara:strand:+ start:316 stop:729 length:414 start_codon:yes stop_codon:yes gene_type:complete